MEALVKTLLVLFEDNTSQQFRPLSWSRPVYEIPCGIFNLRQRAAFACGNDIDLALLPISSFNKLQQMSGLENIAIGYDQSVENISSYDRTIFLSSRYAGTADDISKLLVSDECNYKDENGLVCAITNSSTALEMFQSWKLWDDAAAIDGSRVTPNKPSMSWNPIDSATDSSLPIHNYLWDNVKSIGDNIKSDLMVLLNDGHFSPRSYFGLIAEKNGNWDWNLKSKIGKINLAEYTTLNTVEADNIFVAESVNISVGVSMDASHGPIVLDNNVTIMPNSYIEGPIYIGAGSVIKAGSTIYGETAIGAACKIGGEVAESQFCEFSNKQHDGFMGHAVIGSWCNLGAGTNCSDLSNNYSVLKANFGLGAINTGSQFVGLMIGDHAKSAIGTQFNTATTVGFSSNIFASGFPRTCLNNFTWGDGRLKRSYNVDKAIEVAEIVMGRRNCLFSDAHKELFKVLNNG
jgi:UDP-N-acetylglucosamine diphosphorylase/glucosamine-1-phosphate N-acetyltransferase